MTWTGQRLRDARASKGWTQKEAANQLGAAERSWASWERDEAKPQAHWIAKLDDLFASHPPAAADRLDQATLERALDEASFLDLLAAIARRHAHASKTPLGDAPDLPAGRYVWHTDDAPSARRARTDSDNTAQPDEAPGRRVL